MPSQEGKVKTGRCRGYELARREWKFELKYKSRQVPALISRSESSKVEEGRRSSSVQVVSLTGSATSSSPNSSSTVYRWCLLYSPQYPLRYPYFRSNCLTLQRSGYHNKTQATLVVNCEYVGSPCPHSSDERAVTLIQGCFWLV
jgi:hypothetical protein